MFLLADVDDLHDVISAVTKLAGRWQDLGIALRLHSGDLDAMVILIEQLFCSENAKTGVYTKHHKIPNLEVY